MPQDIPNISIRTELDFEMPDVSLALASPASSAFPEVNAETLGLLLAGTVELPPEFQKPREGETCVDGTVVLVEGKYRLRCDSGESMLLNPQSEGQRLVGRRIRIFGTIGRR
jgi:hypothetical protein